MIRKGTRVIKYPESNVIGKTGKVTGVYPDAPYFYRVLMDSNHNYWFHKNELGREDNK